MGRQVHGMGRPTPRIEAPPRETLIDNALHASDFHELTFRACPLAPRLQWEGSTGGRMAPALTKES